MLYQFKKYFLFLIFLLFILIFGATPASAQEMPMLISVTNLDIFGQVSENGQLSVSEIFSFSEKPAATFSWQINSEKISNLKIIRAGQPLSDSDYQLKKIQGQTKILGLSSLAAGEIWQINYQEKGQFTAKKDNLEFRFQPIKNSGLSISHLNIQINFPKNVDLQKVNQKLYAIHGVENSQFSRSGNSLFYSGDNFFPYSSFVCIVDLEKDSIQIPLSSRILAALNLAGLDFWLAIAIALPLITFVVLFIMIYLRRKRENIKIPEKFLSVPPTKMDPILVGFLFRQKIGPRELAAEILDLAQKGYLVISEKPSGYNLGERRALEDLSPYDQALADELLKGHLKETLTSFEEQPQKELFSEAVAKIYNQAYNEIAHLGYFITNPKTVVLKYKVFGISFFFLSVLAFFIAPRFIDPPYIVFAFFGTAIASLIIIGISGSMPQRTKKGQLTLENWLAFRKYLIEYPEKVGYSEIYQESFILFLPYAIVLDCEKEWADHFAKVPFHLPDWYLSYSKITELPEFCKKCYPLIDTITKTILALKEPIL